jgi:uncharacterized protein (DUF58 family)
MREMPYLLVILVLIALLLRLDFVFYVIYVVGGVWLLARWATPRSMKALAGAAQLCQPRLSGRDHPGQAGAAQPHAAAHALAAGPRGRCRLIWPPPPRSGASTPCGRARRCPSTYDLHCQRRGVYPIGPLQLTSGDVFGFAAVQSRGEAMQYLTVYPRIIPLVGLALPSRLPFGVLASPQRLFEDPARLRGVRPYQAGDSQRRIHWKASAHSDSLLVKQLAPAISLESTILLNLRGRV